MEELHRAAVAYYNNSSTEVQNLAWSFFVAMDSNRDGRVSLPEFTEFLHHSGYGWLHHNSFSDLDRDGDGSLDFWEVLTLYYTVRTRDLVCRTCGVCPKGLYFTCVQCFDHASPDSPTFDLCTGCYSHKNFAHPHSYFLDNYALLRCKRGSGPSKNMQSNLQPFHHPPASSSRISWWNAFKALEVALALGSIATGAGASVCTIM